MTYIKFLNHLLTFLVHHSSVMRVVISAVLLLHAALLCRCEGNDSEEGTVLYYYGLEESERGLRACGARQACAALLRRYWRAPALVRLCRCARRRACDSPAPRARRLPLNNRAQLQFCEPVTDWPECSFYDTPLTVESSYESMNPDQLEEMHHRDIQLTPPTIKVTCRCREPNYWRLVNATRGGALRMYRCSTLPPCKSGDYCGNVNYDLNSLYQSCLCPRNHMCVHNGGITNIQISELLYSGRGWRAYCQPINEDYSYEDF